MVSINDKKKFVRWLTISITFKTREVYWILNYLLNHDVILNRVTFVTGANKTPRGLTLVDKHATQQGMELIKDGISFEDPEQIFHDIRMHWRSPLYIEIISSQPGFIPVYDRIIERNPFIDVKDLIDESVFTRLDEYLLIEANKHELDVLEMQIDQALEEGNKSLFFYLSHEYEKIKKQE